MNRIKQLREEYNISQEELASKLSLSKGIISLYEKEKRKPSLEVLLKLSEIFNCSLDYLMGKSDSKNKQMYIDTIIIEKCAFNSFDTLVNYNLPPKTINLIINNFNYYCNYITNQLNLYYKGIYSNESKSITNFTDTQNKKYFLILHNDLLELLVNANCIFLETKNNKLFLVDNVNYKINNLLINKTIDIINLFINTLNNNYKNYKKLYYVNTPNHYWCPVYGEISAGQPNWAEENIEGYLPIDPELMGIVNSEEHYFLRVRGESMNKVIKNGAFALIHKQDYVENGDIAVVLVNGDNATLKKFSKQEDIIVLTPESTDDSFKQQIYTKDTPIKVIGKYVGKMEFNN